MLRRTILGFGLCLLLTGFGSAADPRPVDVAKYKDVIKVACVGDSITFGSGAKDRANNSYPAQLQKLLGDKWQVKNFGVGGSTMLNTGDKPYEKQGAFKQALEFKPDVVVLKLGTNDSKPQNWKHKDDFAASAKGHLAAFQQANPNVRLYVCLPVPAFPGNFGIRDEIIKGEVIPLLKAVAADKQAEVIDLYAALTGHDKLFPDKVHPNDEGYTLIAKAIAKALTGQESGGK